MKSDVILKPPRSAPALEALARATTWLARAEADGRQLPKALAKKYRRLAQLFYELDVVAHEACREIDKLEGN